MDTPFRLYTWTAIMMVSPTQLDLVSPAIRTALLHGQGGRIFIGNEAYPFSDRYHFQVCYHCQDIGHISKQCPNLSDSPTCLYCSENHRSKDCSNKRNLNKQNCARCAHSKIQKLSENSSSHNSASLECPLYIREVCQQQKTQNTWQKTSCNERCRLEVKGCML